MKTRTNYLMLATALAVTTALGACNRQEPGQAETKTEAKYDEMKNTASEKYDQAKADARDGMDKADTTLSDASITATVKSGLIAEPGLRALSINVDTEEGVVTLTGTVDSHESRDRAEEIARAADGVNSVDNRLDIRAKS